MIYKIQPFEILDKGIATELSIEVPNRFITQDKAIIVYNLRDPNKTSPVTNFITQEIVTISYKILYNNMILVTGADRELIIQDSNSALDILKRERSDISIIEEIK
jgi:hypothetical protein